MSVTEKLRATYFNEFGGRVPTTTEPKPVQLGAWEGLISIVAGLAPAYASIKSAEAEAAAAQAQLEAERIRLAQAAPQAKVSDFLRRYWPHLAVGTAGLITLGVLFRKRS